MIEKKLTKRRVKFAVAILIFSLVIMYGIFPGPGSADSTYAMAKDTLSDSDVSATDVTHTILASTTNAITANGYFEIIFPGGFTAIATSNVTCPSTSTADDSGPSNTVRCTFSNDGLVASSTVITITGVTNPGSEGSQLFRMYSKDSGDAELEKATFQVAIIQDVQVSATVEATLLFTVNSLATTSVINGITTTGSSTATALAFGTIDSLQAYTLGQRLNVSTNASGGFTVTVEQDGNLESGGGADIDSFDDGVPSVTSDTWSAPAGTLGAEATYGHFGLSSDDSNISANDFGAAEYKGFDATTTMEVMYHTGPADGTTDDIGSTSIAYTIQINDLQEAGDYSSNLTYICTPTY